MGAVDHSDLHGAEIIDQVLLIEVDKIDVGDRIRAVDPVWADAVGHMMARDGQKKDIEVCRLPGSTRFTIVDGAHRHAGAMLHGLVYLRAQLVSADRHERRLREIMAQLGHRGLTDPLDRAAFVAELVQLKRAQAGIEDAAHRDASVKKAVRAEADRTMETISNVYGWSDEVGAELGLTGRTIRNDLMLYRGIAPSLIARLRSARHEVLRNAGQLKRLAQLTHDEQLTAVAALLGEDGWEECRSVAEAISRTTTGRRAAADPETKRLSAFIDAFSRMGLAEKKAALAELGGILPAGFRLVEGSAADVHAKPSTAAERQDQLLAAIAFIDVKLSEELQGDAIIVQLIERFGAKARHVGDAIELRIGAVMSSCTGGPENLLRAWSAKAMRAAEPVT